MDMKSAGILGGCVIVAALIFSVVPRNTGGPGPTAGPTMSIHSADASLVVDFQIQTSPTSSEGSKIGDVSDIEFYAGYVVVKTKQGSGMIFYNERTKSLSWSLAKR
jgi:hypothetical protein